MNKFLVCFNYFAFNHHIEIIQYSGHKLDSLRRKIWFQVAKKVLYNVKK